MWEAAYNFRSTTSYETTKDRTAVEGAWRERRGSVEGAWREQELRLPRGRWRRRSAARAADGVRPPAGEGGQAARRRAAAALAARRRGPAALAGLEGALEGGARGRLRGRRVRARPRQPAGRRRPGAAPAARVEPLQAGLRADVPRAQPAGPAGGVLGCRRRVRRRAVGAVRRRRRRCRRPGARVPRGGRERRAGQDGCHAPRVRRRALRGGGAHGRRAAGRSARRLPPALPPLETGDVPAGARGRRRAAGACPCRAAPRGARGLG